MDTLVMDKGYISTSDMGREEWLQKRREVGVGASESPILLGFNNYKSPIDLYYEKMGEESYQEDTLRMRAGRDIEEVIARWFTEDTGLTTHKDNKIRLHDNGCMSCNLDRLGVAFDDRGPFVHEIKMIGANYWKYMQEDLDADSDNPLPLTYQYLQVQHQLAVTGYEFGYISYYVVGDYSQELHHIEIERDSEWIDLIEKSCQDFWFNHVKQEVPPEPLNKKDVEKLYPKQKEGKEIEATDTVQNWIKSRNELQKEIKEKTDNKKEIEDRIASFMGDAERVVHDDNVLATYKQQTRKGYTVSEKSYRVLRIKNQ